MTSELVKIGPHSSSTAGIWRDEEERIYVTCQTVAAIEGDK